MNKKELLSKFKIIDFYRKKNSNNVNFLIEMMIYSEIEKKNKPH